MLIFYISSTTISFFVLWVTISSIRNRLKREGYEINNINITIAEQIKALIPFFIPVFNVCLAFSALLNDDKVYENLKTKYRKVVKNI